VVVAGLAGLQAFREILGDQIHFGALLSGGGNRSGTYQWRAWEASFSDTPFVIAQIPHLSRASSKIHLAECGRWLAGIVGATQA
jgi:hypothetical protein